MVELLKQVLPRAEKERGYFFNGSTWKLQDLLLLDGVEVTDESGKSETSMLPVRNSNSWVWAK